MTETLKQLKLEYENSEGNVRVRREYINHEHFVREVEVEEMYNYFNGEWEESSRYTRDYELSDDGETLKGDGSNWNGTGRDWREWFKQRHVERLQIRFPCEDIES